MVHEVSCIRPNSDTPAMENKDPYSTYQALDEADGEYEIRQREAEEEARAGLDAYPERYDVNTTARKPSRRHGPAAWVRSPASSRHPP